MDFFPSMLLPNFAFLLWLSGSWVILFPVIEIYESFFYFFFLGIRSPSGDAGVILSPCKDILETLRLSLINFFIIKPYLCWLLFFNIFIILTGWWNWYFLVSSVTVSSSSVTKEDLDLSNEVNLFSAMYFSVSFLIGSSKS